MSNSTNSKLAEIEKLALSPTNKHLHRLLHLSYDTDAEVRFRSLEAENFPPNNDSLSRIRGGVRDADELVRTACVEILGERMDASSIDLLNQALHDSSALVRSSAIISLGQIDQPESIALLKTMHPTLNGLEKLSCSISLYLLGIERYLNDAMLCLYDQDYRVRCATANLASRFAKDSDKRFVIDKLQNALTKEETRSASSSISRAIRDLLPD